MLCPGCHREMKVMDRTVNIGPELTMTKWLQCSECLIAAKVTAEFFGLPEDK